MRCTPPLLALLLVTACSQAPAPSAPASTPAAPAPARTPVADPPPAPTAPVANDAAPTGPALSTIPASIHGTWAADAAACAAAAHETRMTISANGIQFYESRGTVKSAREDGRSVIVVLAQEGSGNTWESTRRYTLAGDGRTLSDGDSGLARVRCP